MAEGMPLDVGELVRQLGTSPLFRLLDVASGYLAAAERVEAVNLLLVDYGQELLGPFGVYQGSPLGQERVDQGEAGVAYRTKAARVGRVQLGWQACVPVSLGAERFGVLDVEGSSRHYQLRRRGLALSRIQLRDDQGEWLRCLCYDNAVRCSGAAPSTTTTPT